VVFSTTKHDFGNVEAYEPRYVDIVLSNKGDKQEWLLSVKKPLEVVYIPSNQFIEKDSSIFVRLQVNPKAKGKFNYKVEIYTSDRNEPEIVRLTGSLNNMDENSSNMFTACPTFGDRPGGMNPYSFDLTVITIDKETKEPLHRSDVTLIQSGQPVWTKLTDRKGKITEDASLGFSYFYARHEGYYPAEEGAYINFKRNQVILELERDPTAETDIIAEVPDEEEDTDEEVEITIEIGEPLEDLSEKQDTSFIKELEVPESMTSLEDDNFDDDLFDAINVVFVLDVSSSMNKGDKMELMQYSLYQLTDMLRPQDKMGMVTYASKAKVALEPTSGADKTKIKEQVGALEAGGYTSGGLGIKLGIKQANKGYIKGGVNHVIIITDGAFNKNSSDYRKAVRKAKRKGIHLSVVGIKIKPISEENMKKAAKAGGGHYVPIHELSDAQNNLKQEIRALTYKY
jgi:Ca-activated chloride channel family protein